MKVSPPVALALPPRPRTTPTTLGLLLICVAGGRLLFWSETIFQVNAFVVNLCLLPFGSLVLAILAAKHRRPGPSWQHSHWVFLRRTMVGNAIGGITATLLMMPLLLHLRIGPGQLLWGLASLVITTCWVMVRCLQAIRASEQATALNAPRRYGI